MTDSIFTWHAKVREYELDSMAIVNNATYLNYLEQCRNDYAKSLGIDVVEFFKNGYSLVVAGIEIKYIRPLRAQDEFYVTAEISHYDEKRAYFKQAIHMAENDKLVATAIVTTACVDHKTGKSCIPDELIALLPKSQ